MAVLTKPVRILACVVQVGSDVGVPTGSLFGFLGGQRDRGDRGPRARTSSGHPDPHRTSIDPQSAHADTEVPGVDPQSRPSTTEPATKTESNTHDHNLLIY